MWALNDGYHDFRVSGALVGYVDSLLSKGRFRSFVRNGKRWKLTDHDTLDDAKAAVEAGASLPG